MISSPRFGAISESFAVVPVNSDESDAKLLRSMLSDWDTKLRHGELRLEVRADDEAALTALSRIIVENLLAQDYSESDGSRASVALNELVRNVAEHSSDPDKICAIIVRFDGPMQSVASIMVGDRGSGFNFRATIDRLQKELENGEREHGLLRAIRYGSHLAQQCVSDPHVMLWTRRKRYRSPNSRFEKLPGTIHLIFEYGTDMIRVGDDLYFIDEMRKFSGMAKAFQDLLFDTIRRSTSPIVFIEVDGCHGTQEYFSAFDFIFMILNYCRRKSLDKKLVIYADTEPEDHRDLAEFASQNSIQFFEDKGACLRYLRQERRNASTNSGAATKGLSNKAMQPTKTRAGRTPGPRFRS